VNRQDRVPNCVSNSAIADVTCEHLRTAQPARDRLRGAWRPVFKPVGRLIALEGSTPSPLREAKRKFRASRVPRPTAVRVAASPCTCISTQGGSEMGAAPVRPLTCSSRPGVWSDGRTRAKRSRAGPVGIPRWRRSSGIGGVAPLQEACPSYDVSDGRTTVLLDCRRDCPGFPRASSAHRALAEPARAAPYCKRDPWKPVT